MKKTMWFGAVMLLASAGFAQESRQDVSVSAMGEFSPQITGNAVQKNTTATIGFLGSYRYMLTPRSALELNYSFSQYSTRYSTSFLPNVRLHTRMQEVTAAYVYNFRNYKNFYPFAELGVGGMFFQPIRDYATTSYDSKAATTPGGLFGAGVAYELSPSWDVRVEYRGFYAKTPSFGLDTFKTNRWQVISLPAVGVAYHF